MQFLYIQVLKNTIRRKVSINNTFTKLIKNIVGAIVIITMALLILVSCNKMNYIEAPTNSKKKDIENKKIIIYNYKLGNIIKEYSIPIDGYFSIKFIHSVNKSPVTDYYKFNKDNEIYVYKTIYYNYGAGVETELENNEVLSYGNDGSMIISNINKKIGTLTYYISDLYDHTLSINGNEEISLWDVCGKNILINIIIK